MLPHPSGCVIRPASAADIPEIAAVHARAWQAAYRDIVPEATLRTITVENRARMWSKARLDERPAGEPVLVAELARDIVGFAAAGPPQDDDPPCESEIYTLYVDPDHWRRGVGRALFASSAAVLSACGFGSLYAWVFVANEEARRFYASLGGIPLDGRIRDIDMGGTPVPELPYGWPRMPVA